MEQEKINSPETANPTESQQNNKENFLKEIIKFALIAAVIVLPIRFFVAQPFVVSGGSMDPTFSNGQYLIVDQISYRFEEPKRGDVIIFRYPYNAKKTFFIKRIIGLPSETIQIKNKSIAITDKSGKKYAISSESYINPLGNKPDELVEFPLKTLADDEYFVMGDNRTNSSDSTQWGPLKRSYIVGRPILSLFPLRKISFIPGEGVPVLSEFKK